MEIPISVGYMTVAGRELLRLFIHTDKTANMILVNGPNESRNPMA
jgi:hypothetical protein